MSHVDVVGHVYAGHEDELNPYLGHGGGSE